MNTRAFPVAYNDDMEFQSGMTLRDYFAAAALRGMLSHPNHIGEDYFLAAEQAYRHADAMLKVRGQ
jgi:hypothetical protein